MTAADETDRPDFSAAAVVELRQYTLHPGARDTLVDVFERHLIEPQEDAGIRIGGSYLDEADPDRFVWMRGFADLAQRTEALTSFYLGPTWQVHREVANGTMIDSDDVLLLQPTNPAHPPRPALAPTALVPGNPDSAEARAHISVYVYPPDRRLAAWLSTEVHRILEGVLDAPVATWASHPGPNHFPSLPVRPDNAFVWAATFRDANHRQDALERLRTSPEWRTEIAPAIQRDMTEQSLTLRPTQRSKHPPPGPRSGTDR